MPLYYNYRHARANWRGPFNCLQGQTRGILGAVYRRMDFSVSRIRIDGTHDLAWGLGRCKCMSSQ